MLAPHPDDHERDFWQLAAKKTTELSEIAQENWDDRELLGTICKLVELRNRPNAKELERSLRTRLNELDETVRRLKTEKAPWYRRRSWQIAVFVTMALVAGAFQKIGGEFWETVQSKFRQTVTTPSAQEPPR